ncbi:MAG: citramalate synthase [Candidatus Anoxymicrobium japonicum]|uniref:Citramalate synthase n=1 Tax=Candidatus Anoxymicrobium japonicum TaxID=2013648 RepID=A0A2N3G796_9ACTN|nr:MAG: citramalate synthase [Candidatus Anoxymicrobium japonicum]
MPDVFIYDTTLRDGAAREGVSFSLEDKMKILKRLDSFGVHYIEGGYPASNPKDLEFFAEASKLRLANAKLVTFGSTRRALTSASRDKEMKALVASGAPVACIVGKAWDFHVQTALKISLDENLFMIQESVAYLKKKGLEVLFDAEHFFDAYKENPAYALQAVEAAAGAGVDWVVLCDTNGGALPNEIASITRDVRARTSAPLGIHAHNDCECAVASTLAAIHEGVKMAQGTINGYGERCGNANLCSVIGDLALKMDIDCLPRDRLAGLTDLAHYVSELANIHPDAHQPFVGMSAFAHKGGIHASGVKSESRTYEHIRPELVGNIQRIVVSELSGKSTITLKAKELGFDLDANPTQLRAILKQIKELEHVGYQFEAADGSFEMLVRKALGTHKQFFRLESFRVIMEKREDGKVTTEATVKIHVGGRRLIATAEGNGPVNALDRAVRIAIGRSYPELKDIELTDFKVRVLDEKKGTGAVTRVLIETGDGEKSWGTIGVSENIIEASWQALVDSIEFGLTHKKQQP